LFIKFIFKNSTIKIKGNYLKLTFNIKSQFIKVDYVVLIIIKL